MKTKNAEIIDLLTYRIEKSLKEDGFILKRDGKRKVKVLLKLRDISEAKR